MKIKKEKKRIKRMTEKVLDGLFDHRNGGERN